MTAETDGGRLAQPAGPDDRARPATQIHRSRTDRILAGVCGGIAETYAADPTAVRLLGVIIAIFTGIVPMVVVYLVAAVLIPESTEAGGVAAMTRSPVRAGQAALIIGGVLIIAGIAGLANELLRVDWAVIWPMMLIGLGGLMVFLTMRPERD